MPQEHGSLREGAIAGIIGATSVAVWILIVDVVTRHGALYTPRLLGSALFSLFGSTQQDPALVHVAAYTLFHYGAFILVGVAAAAVVHRAESEPSVLVVFTLLFIIFELGVTGVAAMLAESPLRTMAWYIVALGNVMASLLMGIYLWRTHPALRQEFAHAMGGEE